MNSPDGSFEFGAADGPATVPQRVGRRRLLGWLGAAALAVLAAVAIRGCLLGSAYVASESMLPTLEVGDHVLVNRLAYTLWSPFGGVRLRELATPDRGDVVVFAYPYDDDSMYVGRRLVKRVIGVAGDRIVMRDNTWWLGGVAQPRSVVTRELPCADDPSERCEKAREELGGRTYETLRRVPEFARQRIAGTSQPVNDAVWPPGIFDPTRVKVTARLYAPPQNRDYPEFVIPPNHLLVVGDNRDASQDGRYFGLVPVLAVEGRAERVWTSRLPGHWLPVWSRIGAPVSTAASQSAP